MFLSIVIPTYNRCSELEYLVRRFVQQIEILGKESVVELIICDDFSSDKTEVVFTEVAKNTSFVTYIRYEANIGLERNLIECTKYASGEYLWIFGDDDFLELEDSLEKVINSLEKNQCDLMILNRTRRSFSLEKTISKNWMGIDSKDDKVYEGIEAFYKEWGFISVIGFITVNIMRRQPFLDAYDEGYFGTMYPQLGMMTDAFSSGKVLLVSEPLVCHRTQTAEEKAQAFEVKEKEKVFMSDVDKRDAYYFGAPYIRMLCILVEKGALSFDAINTINENTVINGRLVDFLFNNVVKAVNFGSSIVVSDGKYINYFFASVDLSKEQISRLSRYVFMTDSKFEVQNSNESKYSISVVTPSYNQVQFFNECLDSVFDQTLQPIEQLVLDPGSNDGSLNVARNYKHVTLINEPDDGQGDAVAKGISMAKGDIIAWVNSDDSYFDNEVFATIVASFSDEEDIIYGNGVFMAADGSKIRDVYINKDPSSLSWRFQQEDGILQPALFFKKSVVEKIGLPSKYLEFCMDYEYWIRAMKAGIKFRHIDKNFAKAYFHIDNKTYGQRGSSYLQVCDMQFEQFGYVNHIWLRRYAEYLVEGFDGVIAHSSNQNVKKQEEVDATYVNLLRQYNTSFNVIALLKSKSDEKGYGDTLRELVHHKLLPNSYREVEANTPWENGFVDYVVGQKTWRHEKNWKDSQIDKTHKLFSSLIENRKSDTCVIVCNGPSLNNIDKNLLAQADVIASNNIFLSDEVMKHVDYYTCVNYMVAEASAPHINGLDVLKILPWWLAYCVNSDENTHFVDAKGFPEFSKNIFENMSWRHTVTFFNMHLAYGLGYKKVLIVGCDHSYKQPEGVNEEETIESSEDDVNHFDPRYFKSKKWQAADVNEMEAMYVLAKEAFENDDREIVNCTDGGELKLFRCSTLETEIEEEQLPMISEILRPALIGPFERVDEVHFDETDLVAAYVGQQSKGFMIDVGAHHGYASSPFLSKGWNVIGFEPDPNNRAILQDRLGSHPCFTIVEEAVSDVAGQSVSFYASEESTGVSGLSGFTEKHKKICEVKTTTLKDEIEVNNIESIDFLKIDTEGFDLMVLKGFPWDTHRPKVIECEFENLKTVPLGYTFEDIANFLVSHDYHVYVSEWHPIVRYGIRHNWKMFSRYPCSLSTEKAWGNLLAFDTKPDESILTSQLVRLAKVSHIPANIVEAIKQHSAPTIANNVNKIVSLLLTKFPRIHDFARRVSRKIRSEF
jgi:FkbM family methyltransferase